MEKINLSGSWGFAFDFGAPPGDFTDTITLPGTTSTARKGSANTTPHMGYFTDTYPFEGRAWYRKIVRLENDYRHCLLFLEQTRITEVYIDGAFAGRSDSLCTPHTHDLGRLSAGEHTLDVMVQNTAYPTGGGHMTSPDTQTNWNGITGRIELVLSNAPFFSGVQIYADEAGADISADIIGADAGEVKITILGKTVTATFSEGRLVHRFDFDEAPPLWDEFSPNLIPAVIRIGDYTESITFGVRKLCSQNRELMINGRRLFLRGKHEGLPFPNHGYSPTDPAEWERIFTIAKSYGINHYRFHTCCPPEAAFVAADRLGIYLEPELPFWGTIPDEQTAEMAYLESEGFAILDRFGNHPSFVMLSIGNELWGSKEQMNRILQNYKKHDRRRLYTSGSNNFQFVPEVLREEDIFCNVRLGKYALLRGSYAMCDAPLGFIQTDMPNTAHSYDEFFTGEKQAEGGEVGKLLVQHGTGVKEVAAEKPSAELLPGVPVVTHEIGQYYTYPNLDEGGAYTGSIKPLFLDEYRRKLEENGLLPYWRRFLNASGRFSADCYRLELEAVMRAEKLSGFQLLDLQDFPGQGVALVGMLDTLMRSKGFITPEKWREFCAETVVLARLSRFIFTSGEEISAEALLVNDRPGMDETEVEWSAAGCSGLLPPMKLTKRVNHAGGFGFSIKTDAPLKTELMLKCRKNGVQSTYPLWIYPHNDVTITAEKITAGGKTLRIARTAEEAQLLKKEGEAVLLIPEAEGKLEGAYCTDFWNYRMFRSISESVGRPEPVGTLGLLIENMHPALADFPSEEYSTPPWFNIVMHSHCEDLTESGAEPIVWVIDNLERARKLALLYETDGLVVCTSRLWEIADEPEVGAFALSLLNYITSRRQK